MEITFFCILKIVMFILIALFLARFIFAGIAIVIAALVAGIMTVIYGMIVLFEKVRGKPKKI